jgi:MFS family permease
MTLVPATYFVVAFLFEVPTGAVADLAGRKVSFVLSCVTRLVAFALYIFADSFTDCIIAEFVDAVGTTLASGALDAWAIDGMRAEGSRKPADGFFARAHMLARTLMIVTGLAGGYLADVRMELPWMVGVAGFGATGILSVLLMHEPRAESAPAARWARVRHSLGTQLRDSVNTVRSQPVLRLLCGVTLISAFGVMPVHILWQPHMTALTGEGAWLMGWIWVLLNLAAIAGSAVVPRVLGRFGRAPVLVSTTLWRGAMIAVAGLAGGPYVALVGLLLQETAFGTSEPLVNAWMNEHIEAERRATVLSVRSMAFTLGGGIGLALVGWVARGAGMPTAWLASGAIVATAAAGYVMLGRNGLAVGRWREAPQTAD